VVRRFHTNFQRLFCYSCGNNNKTICFQKISKRRKAAMLFVHFFQLREAEQRKKGAERGSSSPLISLKSLPSIAFHDAPAGNLPDWPPFFLLSLL